MKESGTKFSLPICSLILRIPWHLEGLMLVRARRRLLTPEDCSLYIAAQWLQLIREKG